MKLTKQKLNELILKELNESTGSPIQKGFHRAVKGEYWIIVIQNPAILVGGTKVSIDIRYSEPGSKQYYHNDTFPGNSLEEVIADAKQYVDSNPFPKEAQQEFHELAAQLPNADYTKNINTRHSRYAYGFDKS